MRNRYRKFCARVFHPTHHLIKIKIFGYKCISFKKSEVRKVTLIQDGESMEGDKTIFFFKKKKNKTCTKIARRIK